MRARRAILSAVLLLAAVPAWGASPTIEGDVKSLPYRIVRLKAGGVPEKASVIWRVRAEGARDGSAVDWATPKTGAAVGFVAPPGRYQVELICITPSEAGFSIDSSETVVEILPPTPGPAPGPLPPAPTPPAPTPPAPTPPAPTPPAPVPPAPAPQPDGRLGLVKVSRDGLAKVAAADKVKTARELAGASRSLAAAVAAGAHPDPSGGAQAAKTVLSAWAAANEAAVGANTAAWAGWGRDVQAAFFALYVNGRLKTKADWVSALGEIADGLDPQ